ncbi:MAG: DUF934 domain-containing protein [Methylococcales bacterium]|nr:DUF934 domain-containing protein [Methylococcales bacterium]MDP7561389.1 DUF934 domain-containing protein [Methylococcales bacterium]
MRLIKNREIITDSWTQIADDTIIPDGDIIVTYTRWLADKETLLNHAGGIGLSLNIEDDFDTLLSDLEHFSLIALNFAVFTDGRNFSRAQLLRDRYQFKGEIRAVGGFHRDQVYYLNRVGFNAFELTDEEDTQAEGMLSALDEFSVYYQ